MKIIEDRKTYRTDRDIKCCWTCKHSFSRFNLSLSCKNPDEWVMETSVMPTGICDSWEGRAEKFWNLNTGEHNFNTEEK